MEKTGVDTTNTTLSDEYVGLQELMYDSTVGQIMTPKVVSVTPRDTLARVKELLRLHRISGTPVVDGHKLVGIVSIEDVIKALEDNCIGVPVAERMSRNVVTIGVNERAVEAVRKLSKTGLGRLPVVNEEGQLVGILTKSDMTSRLIRLIDPKHYHKEVDRPESEQAYVIANLVSDDTRVSLRYRIPAKDFDRAGEASSSIKRALQSLNMPVETVRRASIAAYEAEMNVVIHSDGGYLMAEISPEQIRITAEDTGPGIADIEQAMQPGFSTAPDWVRELGFGAGVGLCNIRNCSDQFDLESELGTGTVLRAIIYLKGEQS